MTEPPEDGFRKKPDAKRKGPARDFTMIGEVTDPAFVRLPQIETVFATRSARLAALAVDNPLGPYLAFLSRLTAVQHAAQAALPPHAERPLQPLSSAALSNDPAFAATLEWFLLHAVLPDAPEAAEHARVTLHARSWPEKLTLAQAVFDSAYPAEQLGECLYVAAALQIHLTRLAARMDATRLHPAEDGVCPVCGSAPVASLIVGWASADRARYCCCPLCSTLWNYVRIKCTVCASTEGISYYLIEEQSKDIAVETCKTCGSYVKHFHQHRTPEIEPFADDLASFGLDVLVKQQGFRRATANPFMIVP